VFFFWGFFGWVFFTAYADPLGRPEGTFIEYQVRGLHDKVSFDPHWILEVSDVVSYVRG
jgi:hypothetical protein